MEHLLKAIKKRISKKILFYLSWGGEKFVPQTADLNAWENAVSHRIYLTISHQSPGGYLKYLPKSNRDTFLPTNIELELFFCFW